MYQLRFMSVFNIFMISMGDIFFVDVQSKSQVLCDIFDLTNMKNITKYRSTWPCPKDVGINPMILLFLKLIASTLLELHVIPLHEET